MVKPKEDRSDWVAVQPEFSSSDAAIRPAASAYQFYQRGVTSALRSELLAKGLPADVGHVTKAVSERWKALSDAEKEPYQDMARQDASRFARESHARDVAALERQEKVRRERQELVLVDGERSSRSARRREVRKLEKSKKKQEQKKKKKNSGGKKKKKKHRTKILSDDDDDEDYGDDDDDDSEFEEEEDSDSEASYQSESDEDSDDDDDSSSDSSEYRKPKKKRPPPKPSAAVLARNERARKEREQRDHYVTGRQEELRKDNAAQAKRRLDFLLKQSDIFSHFGGVKEDRAKLMPATRAQTTSEGGSGRRDAIAGDADEGVEAAELDEADEHEATFLTSQPSTLAHGKMRPYQVEGLNWMIRLQEHGVNGILADEMGLGKTLQSISVLVYMKEYRDVSGPHLIVVPKSTLSNWMNELERWAPGLSTVKFHGSKDEREEISKNVLLPAQRDRDRDWNVCVTTYEVCNIEKNVLNKFAWSYLIIDEAHRLKNEGSAFSRTVRAFETRYRLLLTGTPLQNNLHELWALLNFLVPDVFASAEQFDDWFNLDIEDADEKNRLISQLHKILRPFMLRRLKADVEKNLPPKRETILFTGMSETQKKLYRDILMRDIGVIQGNSGSGGSGSRTAILNIVMQLRKCAGHPYLFPGVEDRSLPPLGEHLVQNCGKMVLLDKLLLRLKEMGRRVLLFTQMTRILDILEDYMVMRGFSYCRIDGNTSYELREEYIDTFNAPNSPNFIFLLSTRAGGLGINLQTADTVLLYDSDWNPQADLQAQDRAHRIGQKREVQVFRFVTEHTIEEKIVERAQQKLKLDAMVVQQGRLKDKDKLSRDELLEAVRFGADKIFKSKDSSITDDDIDLILDIGRRKTQELNDKLQNADKGDMLDFKLDGGISAQTFEGIDYSQQGKELAEARAAQMQAQLLGIMDMGKRERKTVANYNENQLYQQQLAALQGARQERKKKEKKLPKFLRMPRLDEWQMFDRERLQALQKEEEASFRSLPEEVQKLATTKVSVTRETEESENEASSAPPEKVGIDALPPLLSEEKQSEKRTLLSEGFSDWGRHHYTSFVRACAKYGRNDFAKISAAVGKTETTVQEYAKAFWDVDMGKKRFTEHEYERVVKLIERGEKRIEEVKGLERGTRILISLFDNPWVELEFTHVNCKDKMFSMEEDRHLLCWAHKYGYGNWLAIKMAIRRSANFRFDYFLKSLPVDLIGRRCESLMRAAEKEVDILEKLELEENGMAIEDEKKDDLASTRPPIQLPKFKIMQTRKRVKTAQERQAEQHQLEKKVEDIEAHIRQVKERMKMLQDFRNENFASPAALSNEFPEELLGDLANLVARSGPAGIVSLANAFSAQHPGRVTKTRIISKIEEIAVREKREEDGDTRAVWHILPDHMHLVDVETLQFLRRSKEERLHKEHEQSDPDSELRSVDAGEQGGAVGPDGEFCPFPDYDGTEPPRECKKAFTLFCRGTKKEIKESLKPVERRNKDLIHRLLKKKWMSLDDDERETWHVWEIWDAKRYNYETFMYEKSGKRKRKHQDDQQPADLSVPKRKKAGPPVQDEASQQTESSSTLSIPKKKRHV